jgi:diguanylate cyclase (GGDEF)-like protein
LLAPLPSNLSTVLLFVAVGMIWSAARLFHGRRVSWIAMPFGAVFWLLACFVPAFALSAASRIVVSSLIVAGYTFLTAAELRRERRKSLIRRWPAAFVPMLHGAIFLFPVALATLTSDSGGVYSLARGWIAVFAIEIVLYVVGTAFIVLILAKDRTVHAYKVAATTDPLTGLLNRRGFFEATAALMRRSKTPISVLAFDLDHFKSINDRCGHAIGDAVLELFAKVARQALRTNDIVGRLGGEEFVAVLACTLPDAAIAAERVRSAFAAASLVRNGQHVAATVSIGIANGSAATAIDLLIARADTALYRAKTNGRDRVETATEDIDCTAEQAANAKNEGAPYRRRVKEKSAANDRALESCVA